MINENLNPRRFQFKIEDNNYIWENCSIKLVFSKPSIQGYDEHALIKTSKGILYYYYDVEIYRRVYDDCDEENDKYIYKWDLVASRGTHDFPCIEQLQCILEEMINLNPVIDGEKHEYKSGNIRYSKHYHTEGFGCDDFYEVTKYTTDKGIDPSYVVYLGCTFDSEGDLESAGIRTPYIYQEDIVEFLNCVNSFIQYSIDIHNKHVAENNLLASINKEIVDGKLYEYDTDDKNSVNKDVIESIYIIGDKMDITVLETNNKGDIYSEEYNIVITDIRDGKIIDSDNRVFDIDKIMYIMDDVPLEKKHYNIDMVTKDFLELMTNKEKEDFKELSEEKIFEKYVWAIINRTTMCWDDTHNFPTLVEKGVSDWNIKNAKEVVKIVIKNIKTKISED